MSDLVQAVIAGRPAGWEDRPCTRCGAPARWPVGLVRGTALEGLEATGVLCDECESDDTYELLQEIVEAQVDPEELIMQSGIPEHEEVDLKPVFLEWLEFDETSGLFVVGDVGTGKSWQAHQLVRHWCQTTSRPARYVNEVDLHERLRDWDNRQAFRNELRRVPLLVIDDIGTAKASVHKASDVYDLIDHREQHARNRRREIVLRTVFVSNYVPGVLKQLPTMDERVFVRIQRMCGGAAKKMTKDWEENTT